MGKKDVAALRVAIVAEDDAGAMHYATAFYLTLTRRGDIYGGPGLDRNLAGPGYQLFRHSYHRDGKTFLRVPGGLERGADRLPPVEVRGKIELGGGSGSPDMLEWRIGRPDEDNERRRTMTIDLGRMERSWTAQAWAIEPGRPDLVDEVLASYGAKGEVLACAHADWCQPELLLLIWTLTPAGWAALDRSLAEHGIGESPRQ